MCACPVSLLCALSLSQGLVAEFVQAHSDVFALLAIHAVQWDGRASRGRLGTFTDRWGDFTSGTDLGLYSLCLSAQVMRSGQLCTGNNCIAGHGVQMAKARTPSKTCKANPNH